MLAARILDLLVENATPSPDLVDIAREVRSPYSSPHLHLSRYRFLLSAILFKPTHTLALSHVSPHNQCSNHPHAATHLPRSVKVYQTRIPDPRLLIPIIPGLSKQELRDYLPKLVMLPHATMAIAMNRILTVRASPLSPSELVVALHFLDPATVPVKKAMEGTVSFSLLESFLFAPSLHLTLPHRSNLLIFFQWLPLLCRDGEHGVSQF